MSAGDITAAILTVKVATTIKPTGSASPLWSFAPDAPLSVTCFFVKEKPDLLHLSVSGTTPIAEIKAGQWTQAKEWPLSSWFLYANNQITWGTTENDTAQPATQLNPGAVVPSSSVTASASSTPTTTLTSGTNSNASAPSVPTYSTATPTATIPTSQVPNGGNSKGGGSSGAIAGAAVGCLIAGALIAGLIFWFLGRKRKASHMRDYESSNTALMPHEKGFGANTIPLGSGSSAASPIASPLPLPLEDKAITGEVSKISNSIKNHVQSYYQISRVSPRLIDLDDIHAIGSHQPISASILSTLLDNPATREIALRFCVAWVVCSRMQPASDSRMSLLPVEVAGCFRMMANERSGSSGHTSSKLAGWRVMTAELLQSSYIRDPFTASDSRNGSIQAAVGALENILQPFADSRIDNGERKRNLEEILKRSALFAFTLFSQPSTWDFDWREAQGVQSGELCIFPALVQLTNETGQPVNPPRPFSEAVVRRINE